MDIDLKIPARPGGEVKIPANERKPIPQNEQPVQPLREGDPLSEWSEWKNSERPGVQYRVRQVVGRLHEKKTWWNGVAVDWHCQFCRTMTHEIHKEFQRKWVGRDKKEYVVVETDKTREDICPKCGYRW